MVDWVTGSIQNVLSFFGFASHGTPRKMHMRIGTMWSLALVIAAILASCAANPLGSEPSEIDEVSSMISEIPIRKYQSSKDIDLLLSLMGSHLKSAAVQEQALSKLGALAVHGDKNKVALAARGGIEAVVDAMKKHFTNPAVHDAGLWALLNLAAHAETSVAIAAKGGIDVVVRAMSAHRSNVGVQARGCWALENVADSVPEKVVLFSFLFFLRFLCSSCEPQRGPRKARPPLER